MKRTEPLWARIRRFLGLQLEVLAGGASVTGPEALLAVEEERLASRRCRRRCCFDRIIDRDDAV